jgi:integrase
MRALAAGVHSQAGLRPDPAVTPVEYAVAVDCYLAQAPLRQASRRVYRISLMSWAWPLVGKPFPGAAQRRRAVPPVVPLATLDDPAASERLAAAVSRRAAEAGVLTVNRELSALRSAAGWWREQRWIRADPTAGLRHAARPPAALPPLDAGQAAGLFRAAPCLREHAFWRVLYDTGAAAGEVLGLDVEDLDLRGHRARLAAAGTGPQPWEWITWPEATTELLRWLLAGRPGGPVFVTARRVRAGAGRPGICPVTGRARMSYRRAAEIFTAVTRPLDPAGRGWTLHQLSQARAARR